MNLERELVKLVWPWHVRQQQMFESGDDSEIINDSFLLALGNLCEANESALHALAEGPPKLDGLPTVPGWYWLKHPKYVPQVRHVKCEDGKALIVEGFGDFPVSDYRGTWRGPLPEPEGPCT